MRPTMAQIKVYKMRPILSPHKGLKFENQTLFYPLEEI